jgi:hypothetical protein
MDKRLVKSYYYGCDGKAGVDAGVAGVSDMWIRGSTNMNTGSRRGVVDISHHLSHPNCAHEHRNTSMSKIGRGTWQTWRVSHTLIDTNSTRYPELVFNRIKAVHGRRSLPAGPCRIVLTTTIFLADALAYLSHPITRACVTTRRRGRQQ